MEALARFIHRVGVVAAWIAIPGQIVVAVSYIVGRQFFLLPGTRMQELEWHFFVALVFMSFGMALLADRHVRIDIARHRMSERSRAMIEIIGFFIAVLPFCILLVYLGTANAWAAFWLGERSPAALGLPSRWIVKSTFPIGALLLLLAGAVVTSRNVAILRKAPTQRSDQTLPTAAAQAKE